MRKAVAALAALAGAAWCGAAGGAEAPAAGALCAAPRAIEGFRTCADPAAAEQEGEIVIYSIDPEGGATKLLAAFNRLFPRIKANYVRLQAGALYAKLLSERQARVYVCDILFLSDMGLVLDFQKKNGYAPYLSPEMAAYKTEYKSRPEGYWSWGGMIAAGIAYNPQIVPPQEAPKSWADVFDPKWTDQVNTKNSNSGLQHEVWYELRRVHGADFWSRFGAVKPRPIDSYVQQYDRLINHQDKLAHTAVYAGYVDFKGRGAPVAFVAPEDGLPAGPEPVGIVADAPHPQAARLFLDWFLSPLGQRAYSAAFSYHSVRADVPPPENALPLSELKLLIPADWQDFLASKTAFNREWDRITGVR